MSNISAQLVKELRERSGAGMMECKKALVENNGDIEVAMEWLRKSGLAKADKKASRVAAEGRIVAAQAPGKAVLVEINCETDFVAKDASFLKFSDTVADVALNSGAADIDALKAAAYPGATNVEEAAKALIATIGEKIDVRRLARVATDGIIGSYIHGGRIGVLVALKGGSGELAKGIAMHVAAMNPAYVRAEDVPADFLAKEKEIALAAMSDKEKNKPADILEKIVSGKVHKIVSEITLLGQPYVLDTNVSVAEALKKEGADVVSVARLAVGEGIEKVEEDFAAEVMKQAGLR
ncbi:MULTISPECIES: translation elongation factor Ts [Rhodanobacter]|uniref:translation elongation factor Ts n=1 Tax=Rhodanobacter TaxID=75309 RepID=UPI000422B724|nr:MULTISPECIES: translation elongation factor Ts [Rhodanobacter]KZC19980.1 elongation factor Ts [Rhodanobacter denitrificans]UJJ52093.1 translation elongation factor Ts [Rhodanobacter denitrificans]UJM94839.1 translation elongation factor Ts [Rhodanobacter denitrificans]UJM98369.1 translation elongation factor Ts [Rhodanobacter denitrificans]UJN22218.1 translation elongation factor Ts [Rhodanobacter denitrificans]